MAAYSASDLFAYCSRSGLVKVFCYYLE
uniref:Uncharacterized protein n=1 Tax=Rhizophora mucronata TaxID=61149 RepID=A0A2P2PN05_RHIMU